MATKKNDIMENETMTEETKNTLIRQYEDDILGGLIAAASYKDDEQENALIQIIRNKKIVLEFHIRPMGEDEYLKCRKDNTTYRKNKQVGTRVAESVNTSRYRAQLIYKATVEEDRDKIWDNHQAWSKLACVNGIDLVDVVLKAGEKDMIIEKLDEISGYQISLEETAKN